MTPRVKPFALTTLLLTAALAAAQSRVPPDPLAAGFQTPPDSAKPRTWWHWTNGNVTESGITKDLEWMHRVGIGGFQLVDVAAGNGQVVEPKINFGTPEWYHAVRHSAEDARRLNLEMSIFSCAGWSEAGGPWVTPEMAMKRLVWSEATLTGGAHVSLKLPDPPSNEGPVRDSGAGAKPGAPHFYRDQAVIAYRTPAAEVPMQSLHPKVSTSNGPLKPQEIASLLDDALATSIILPSPRDGSPAWLQYEFPQPYTARALSFGVRGRMPVGRVLASDDGIAFRTLADLPGPQGYHGASIRTFAFPSTTARFFRVELSGAGLTPAAVIHGAPVQPAPEFGITEAIFYASARVNRWEDKAAFGSLMDVYEVVPTPPAPLSAEIPTTEVLDLTAHLSPDGTLQWDAPAGQWTILRMGYALTGAKNRPSVPAGSGYEVDKLNATYVHQYFQDYIDPLAQALGPLLGTTTRYMTMDSWEAGMQNWTPGILTQFRKLRGYDPTPYLPVLTGRVVQSADISDRFLWDFRRTLADLYASQFYGTMDDELHQRHMELYSEASGVALEIPEDTLLNKSHADIPMAEFWVHALHPEAMYNVDVRGAASAAHIYGKPLVATESFTGGGYESPYTLKKIADYWFTQGVNRLVFHTSAQQPLDTKPGNTMVGTHINRNITWAEQAAPFMTYIARISFLLQQGSPVADIAFLLPEGAPSTMPFWGAGLQPAPPPGYDYDFLNTDILLHHTTVTPEGRLHIEGSAAMPAGMDYRLLVLPPTTVMTPAVAKKLKELVAAGATLSGPRPLASPSLLNFPSADQDLTATAEDLWAATDGLTLTQHQFGKGMVYAGLTLDEILSRLHTPPDFASTGALEAPPAWVHRRLGATDIYFLANQTDHPVHLQTRLRTTGKDVQIWRPMTGRISTASTSAAAYTDQRTGNRQPNLQPALYAPAEGFTTVTLDLAERESVFLIFRGTPKPTAPQPPATTTILRTMTGPWHLTFPNQLGAPPPLTLTSLESWTNSPDPLLKYFSGTATYTSTFTAPPTHGRRTFLQMEKVRDLAQVKINGKPVGLLWAPPYRIDITEALKPGPNKIEIEVTNEWTNRLIGDRALPAAQRILAQPGTSTASSGAFGVTPQLTESGLIGPITLTTQPTELP